MVIILVIRAVFTSENKIKNDEEAAIDPDTRSVNFLIPHVKRFLYTMMILSIITWFGWAATPTKKDCVMIIAGGGIATFLTSDTNARQIPAELSKLSVVAIQSWQDQIKDFSVEDRKNIGILTPEEKVKDDYISKMKQMSKEEIIKYLEKSD